MCVIGCADMQTYSHHIVAPILSTQNTPIHIMVSIVCATYTKSVNFIEFQHI